MAGCLINNTSQINRCILTALLLWSSISQFNGINSTRIGERRLINSNVFGNVIFPDQLRDNGISSNQLSGTGVQTAHQPQKTTIPTLAQCGRSPAKFGRKNKVQTPKPDDFPWLAAVGQLKNQQSLNGRVIQRREFRAMCGGTLITDRHVLSAAHCFFSQRIIRDQPTHVRLGEHDLRKDGDGSQDFRIVDKQTHNFNHVTNFNDIILLKLERRVIFNGRISPACLPFRIAEEKYYHTYLTVVGWGMTTKSVHNSFTPMREEPVHVPLQECWQNYRHHATNQKNAITSNNICAGRGDADACMGDSGGPLNYSPSTGPGAGRVFVVGIVSFGPSKCGSSKLPGVYTNVAKYLNWISNNLN